MSPEKKRSAQKICLSFKKCQDNRNFSKCGIPGNIRKNKTRKCESVILSNNFVLIWLF